MKKLNNKGITTIEIIVCFALIVIIATSLYSTVSAYNEKRLIEKYKSEIYTYKNLLTKTIQDDLIKKGLKSVTYTKYTNANNSFTKGGNNYKHYKEIDNDNATVVYEFNFTLSDTTSRRLVIFQRFAQSDDHPSGTTNNDDYFTIMYGVPDMEKNANDDQNKDLLDYPIPDLGSYDTDSGHIAHDLIINNILVDFGNDSTAINSNVLSLYIGFYHPELSTRYAINIVCPINYSSHPSQKSDGFRKVEQSITQSQYMIRYNVNYVYDKKDSYEVGIDHSTDILSTDHDIVGPFDADQQITLRPNEFIVNGYRFKGYSLSKKGSSILSSDAKLSRLGKNREIVEVYAQWEKVYGEYESTCVVNTFNVPVSGKYLIRVWGAQGGGDLKKNSTGGYGGYAKATVFLNEGTTIYAVVGEKGAYTKSKVNISDNDCYGSEKDATSEAAGTGGGASYVSYSSSTTLDKIADNQIIVIGAGGGGAGATDPKKASNTSNGSGGYAGYFNFGKKGNSNVFDINKVSFLSYQAKGSALSIKASTYLELNTTNSHIGRKPVFGTEADKSNGRGFSGGGGSGYRGGYNSSGLGIDNYFVGGAGGISYSIDTSDSVSNIYSTLTNSYSSNPEDLKFKVGNGYVSIKLIENQSSPRPS